MTHLLHTIMDTASGNYCVRATIGSFSYNGGMIDDGWKLRLDGAIKSDGRSLASICEAAGLSRNYIGSIYRDNREPTVPKLWSC